MLSVIRFRHTHRVVRGRRPGLPRTKPLVRGSRLVLVVVRSWGAGGLSLHRQGLAAAAWGDGPTRTTEPRNASEGRARLHLPLRQQRPREPGKRSGTRIASLSAGGSGAVHGQRTGTLPGAVRAPSPQRRPSPSATSAATHTRPVSWGVVAADQRGQPQLSLPALVVLIKASRQDPVGDAGRASTHGRLDGLVTPASRARVVWEGAALPVSGQLGGPAEGPGRRGQAGGPWHFTAVSHPENTKDDVTRRWFWVAPSN